MTAPRSPINPRTNPIVVITAHALRPSPPHGLTEVPWNRAWFKGGMRRNAASTNIGRTAATVGVLAAVLYAVLASGGATLAAEGGPPAAYEATRTRPLFSPTRRPPPPPAPAFVAPPVAMIAPAPVMAPDLAVSGVIVGTDTRIAIVKRPSDAVFTRVTRGSQIDGWTVSEIEPRAVVLRRDDRSVTIGMPEPQR